MLHGELSRNWKPAGAVFRHSNVTAGVPMCRCEDGAYEVPLIVAAKEEGGYKVTSPALPELIAEGETREDALNNAQAALGAVLDLYEEMGKPLPFGY